MLTSENKDIIFLSTFIIGGLSTIHQYKNNDDYEYDKIIDEKSALGLQFNLARNYLTTF